MVGLGARTERRILGLDEITDAGLLADDRAGPQPREWADHRTPRDTCSLDMAEGPDLRPIFHRDSGSEYDARSDHHVAAEFGVVGEVDGAWVEQGRAAGHRARS